MMWVDQCMQCPKLIYERTEETPYLEAWNEFLNCNQTNPICSEKCKEAFLKRHTCHTCKMLFISKSENCCVGCTFSRRILGETKELKSNK